MFSNLIQSQIRSSMMSELMKNMGGGGNGGRPAPSRSAVGMPAFENTTDVNQAISYKPEHSWNYEIGGRSQLIDHRLFADLSLFYIDCHDQQIAAVSGYGRVTKIRDVPPVTDWRLRCEPPRPIGCYSRRPTVTPMLPSKNTTTGKTTTKTISFLLHRLIRSPYRALTPCP